MGCVPTFDCIYDMNQYKRFFSSVSFLNRNVAGGRCPCSLSLDVPHLCSGAQRAAVVGLHSGGKNSVCWIFSGIIIIIIFPQATPPLLLLLFKTGESHIIYVLAHNSQPFCPSDRVSEWVSGWDLSQSKHPFFKTWTLCWGCGSCCYLSVTSFMMFRCCCFLCSVPFDCMLEWFHASAGVSLYLLLLLLLFFPWLRVVSAPC